MARLLDIDGVSTGYNGVSVVRDLTMHVDEGEVVTLLGPNGAGKTTTLLTVSGLVPLMAGKIEVFGRSVEGRRPHRIAREGLAHVPEGRALFYQLTVGENLRLGAGKGSLDIKRALSYFPALEPLMGRRAGLLSGGEQQMLAMARALTVNPRLLLVDEMKSRTRTDHRRASPSNSEAYRRRIGSGRTSRGAARAHGARSR